jgi:ABC-type nitrate/sulfonate/bicarbonate transport system substrate-binding protein
MIVTRHRALSTIAAGAGALLTAGQAGAQDVPLRVVAFSIDSSAEPYFALDQGFFKAAGLDVTLETGANGPAVAAGVVSGAIDIGLSNVITLAQARARGVNFVLVAPASDYSSSAPTTLMVVPSSSLRRHSARRVTSKRKGFPLLSFALLTLRDARPTTPCRWW